MTLPVNHHDLNLIRQWFNAVEDLAPETLEAKDYDVMQKICGKLGFPFKRKK